VCSSFVVHTILPNNASLAELIAGLLNFLQLEIKSPRMLKLARLVPH